MKYTIWQSAYIGTKTFDEAFRNCCWYEDMQCDQIGRNLAVWEHHSSLGRIFIYKISSNDLGALFLIVQNPPK
jgi:hypothetical protein